MNRILSILTLMLCLTTYAQPMDYNKKDSQGRKQGVWKKTYKGIKAYRYIGQFKDDVPYGKFVYYYENGAVEAVVQFSDNGKTTRSQMYHHSGYMMAKGKYTDKLKDSTWVYYDDRGYISYTENYKGGKMNGQKVYYYAPRDGKYYVARYEYYKDDLLHGEYKEYHENTKVKETGRYVDGNRAGKVIHYYPNGNMKKVLRYKYTVLHGPSFFFDEKGHKVGEKWWWEGKLYKKPEGIERIKALWEKSGGK